MQKLRTLHLYLSCVFAPMLLFFIVSGVWQMCRWNDHDRTLALISTIHKARGLKSGPNLSSPLLRAWIYAMSAGLVITTILGVIMALKYSKRRAAVCCLVIGILLPLALALSRLSG